MRVKWRVAEDPREFACAVLGHEAPDINQETLRRSEWAVETMSLDAFTLAPGLVEAHDAAPIHVRRRDNFVEAIRAGQEIPPLIVIGTELRKDATGNMRYLLSPFPEVGAIPFLADGYARYRALRLLGIDEAAVVRQRPPDHPTAQP